MRILLDNGIFIHAEFAKGAVKQTSERWGRTQLPRLYGVTRKAPDKNVDYQQQKEALFTVGRLIREGQIEAFDYWEIRCERWRGKPTIQECNALQSCEIRNCEAAIQRSKFRKTIDLTDLFAKGGKKDIDNGVELGDANQIAFLRFLSTLTQQQVGAIVQHSSQIGLTQFEIDSFKGIRWFQLLCRRCQSAENYPDVFHLWTAERNGLDAVLTLEGDTKLPGLVAKIRHEKKKEIEITTEVLRPLALLQKLGISKHDPVPMEIGRFYHLHELT